MKNILAIFGQFLLFVLVFLGGSFFPPMHLKWFVTHPTPTSTRLFVPDGLLLMLVLSLVILLIESVAKRLRTAGVGTSIALFLALILGLAAKFGFVTQSLY
jgi:hypothetical protein